MIALFPSRTVFLELGGFSIHWYGVMYLLAFIVAWLLLPGLQRFRDLTWSADAWSTLLSWAVLGVLAGGRLGFILFYRPSMLWTDPLEAIAVWHGGMSSHGGFLGVTLSLLWALRKKKADILRVADVVAVPVAIGLAFGRVGNFINQELYGSPTDLPWAIRVPGETMSVHPTQLYAVAKDLLIALACFLHLRRPSTALTPGRTLALFLMLYAVLRGVVEEFRVQEYDGALGLTRGQLLTLPLMFAGACLWFITRRRAR
jgi:phosphatidylglycerol---prolipoprotein diacylglyceryl transferase